MAQGWSLRYGIFGKLEIGIIRITGVAFLVAGNLAAGWGFCLPVIALHDGLRPALSRLQELAQRLHIFVILYRVVSKEARQQI